MAAHRRQLPRCTALSRTSSRCFIPDKDLRKLLESYDSFLVTHTRRHLKISHPLTGDFVIAPVSGSDWRGLKNLRRDLDRLLETGRGYVSLAAQRRHGGVQ